jgi:hypothetical protein
MAIQFVHLLERLMRTSLDIALLADAAAMDRLRFTVIESFLAACKIRAGEHRRPSCASMRCTAGLRADH